ncbi:transmembrane protein 42 [Rhineura floridana]|uniref:transmembrane protein 42 n=1 Tax=Rhineura floridana TaxID=261503 RepID=UPI002AC7FB09|nr:transmembrane protein 42 [Rhineura floridana]
MPVGWGAAFAAGAGLLGALAACSAKLALGADYLREGCVAVIGGEEPAASVCAWLPMILRVGCGGLVLAFNAIMWTFFAKALGYSSSSATATVTSAASNFISSAFLGKLLFGETHALLWWIGISITLLGLLLLHTAPSLLEEQRHLKEKKK